MRAAKESASRTRIYLGVNALLLSSGECKGGSSELSTARYHRGGSLLLTIVTSATAFLTALRLARACHVRTRTSFAALRNGLLSMTGTNTARTIIVGKEELK